MRGGTTFTIYGIKKQRPFFYIWKYRGLQTLHYDFFQYGQLRFHFITSEFHYNMARAQNYLSLPRVLIKLISLCSWCAPWDLKYFHDPALCCHLFYWRSLEHVSEQDTKLFINEIKRDYCSRIQIHKEWNDNKIILKKEKKYMFGSDLKWLNHFCHVQNHSETYL